MATPNPYGCPSNPWLRGRILLLNDDIIDEGNFVIVDTTTGEAQKGIPATASRVCVGWAMESVDNSADGESVPVSCEPHAFYGKAGDLPTVIGATVYVWDANTVMKTAGSNPVTAGTLLAIDGTKYYVRFNV